MAAPANGNGNRVTTGQRQTGDRQTADSLLGIEATPIKKMCWSVVDSKLPEDEGRSLRDARKQ